MSPARPVVEAPSVVAALPRHDDGGRVVSRAPQVVVPAAVAAPPSRPVST